jgi:hypothetical protein
MNISEVANLIGLDIYLLRHMRARESITLKSGPPFCKTIDAVGNTKYVYKKTEVMKWLKRKHFRITAGDAAKILGISRDELMGDYRQGLHSWENPKGKLIVEVRKNIFIWMPKVSL